MPVATRGARFHLPPSVFKEDDLVIDIPAPAKRLHPSIPEPYSDHIDEDRFKRHRKYLLQTYGADKFLFRGYDDFQTSFQDPSPGQIVVDNVYGMYEVGHWPSVQKQRKKTKQLLRSLERSAGMQDEIGVEQETPSDGQDEDEDVMEDTQVPSSPPTLSRQRVEQAFGLGSDDTEPLLSSSPNARLEPELPPSRPGAVPKSGKFDSAAEKYRQQQIKQAERIRAQRQASLMDASKEPVDIRERIAEGLEPRFRTTGTRAGRRRKSTEQTQSLTQKPPGADAGEDPSATIDPQLLRPGSATLPTPEASPLLDPVGLSLKRNADQASLEDPERKKRNARRPGNDLVPPTSRSRASEAQKGLLSPQSQHQEPSKNDRLRDELKSRPRTPVSAPGAREARTSTEQPLTVATVRYTMPPLEAGESTQDVHYWRLNNANALLLPTDLRANVRCLPQASQIFPQDQAQHFAVYNRLLSVFVRHIFFKLLATPQWRDKKVTEVHRETRRQMYLQFYEVELKWLTCLRNANAHNDDSAFQKLYMSMNRLINDSDEHAHGFKVALAQKAAQAAQQQESRQQTPSEEPQDNMTSIMKTQFAYLCRTLAFYTEPPDVSRVFSGDVEGVKRNFRDNIHIAAFAFQRQIMYDAIRRAERSKAKRIAGTGLRWFKAENGSQAKGDYIIDLFSQTGKWRPRDWVPPPHSSEADRTGGKSVVYHGGQYQWNQVHPRINFAGQVTPPGHSLEVNFKRDTQEIDDGGLDMSLYVASGHTMVRQSPTHPQPYGQQLSEQQESDIGRRVQDQIQLQTQRRQQMHQAQAALAQGQPYQQVNMPPAQPVHRPHPLAQAWTPSEPNTPLAASSSQRIAAISPNRAAVSQAMVSPGLLGHHSQVGTSPSNVIAMQQQFQHFAQSPGYHQLTDIQKHQVMQQIASMHNSAPSFSPSKLDPHLQNSAPMTPSMAYRTAMHRQNGSTSPQYTNQQYEEAIQRTIHMQQHIAQGQGRGPYLVSKFQPPGGHRKAMPQQDDDRSGLFIPNPLSRSTTPVINKIVEPSAALVAGTGRRKSRRSAAANAEARTKVFAEAEAGSSDPMKPEQEYDNKDAEGETDADISAPARRNTKGGRRLYAMKGASLGPKERNASPVAAGRKAQMTEVERWGGKKKKKMGRPRKSATPATRTRVVAEEPFIDDEPSSPTEYGLTTRGRMELERTSQRPFLQQLQQVRDEARETGNDSTAMEKMLSGSLKEWSPALVENSIPGRVINSRRGVHPFNRDIEDM